MTDYRIERDSLGEVRVPGDKLWGPQTQRSLAIYATQAKRVTDEMFIVAARAVAEQVTDRQREEGMLYPLQSNILDTELRTAAKVAEAVFERGLAPVNRPADIGKFIRQHAHTPTSTNLV
jgi:malate dehydrogenase (oxaloacetate-decarboxylating)(NADP+)